MKLTVWLAEQNADSQCYNLIGRTRKEVRAQIEKRLAEGESIDTYGEPVKVVIEYADAFDLFDRLTGEGGGRHRNV